jgi:hypothetical protein
MPMSLREQDMRGHSLEISVFQVSERHETIVCNDHIAFQQDSALRRAIAE